MKVERALAWYCHILLDRHQHLIVATVGRDGLPQLARVPYRRDGDEIYVAVASDAPIAGGLGAVGPVAALLVGDDSLPLVSIGGAAEQVEDGGTIERVRTGFPAASGGDAIYRLMPDSLLPLQGAMEARVYPDGAAIVRQGEIADRYYVILAGECEVSRVTGGAPQSLAQLQAGAFFGESGLLAGAPRNASVFARGEVTAVSLSRTAFSTVIHHTGTAAADLASAIRRAVGEE
ncbi:MAG: cyclic nucleotide-binding domain-containing protein [Thermomicrobiales bacterium]